MKNLSLININKQIQDDKKIILQGLLNKKQKYLVPKFFYDEKFNLAIESFNFLIDKFPDLIDSSVHAFLAESYYELEGKFSANVTNNIDKALYMNPSNTRALSLKGLNFFQQENFEEALKSWSIAFENSTNNKEKESLIIVMNLALKKLKK
mgnify:FL=1